MLQNIDTTNMCSHLQKKLFDEDGAFHQLWLQMQDDPELTAVVRSRQLHIYHNGKKVLVLKGKSEPQIVREDPICDFLDSTKKCVSNCLCSQKRITKSNKTRKR